MTGVASAMNVCQESLRLLDAYKHALDLCSLAARALEVARPTSSFEEYRRLQDYLEQARAFVQTTGARWDEHRGQHGC